MRDTEARQQLETFLAEAAEPRAAAVAGR
jgi:hypothetical protein